MEFEWDPEKAEFNLQKHDVGFTEATTVFDDPLSIAYSDPRHSIEEDRYIIIGFSNMNRLLIVAHTDRGSRIRIISARLAVRSERALYEHGS
jgi:uncharacterized DUF497 family protein